LLIVADGVVDRCYPIPAGSFYVTQLVIQVYFGLFVGFYFYKLQHTPGNMQFATLALLVVAQGLPCLTVDLACNMLDKFNLFLARERLGIYSWYALLSSLMVVAMPCLLVSYNLLFFCYYWTLGMNGTAADGALVWLNWNVTAFFTSSFAMLIGAVSPSALAVPYVISLIWNLFNNLSWALVVYDGMPSPFHYFFSVSVEAALSGAASAIIY
jgi:ABC-type multidrug transport system permease subunit